MTMPSAASLGLHFAAATLFVLSGLSISAAARWVFWIAFLAGVACQVSAATIGGCLCV